MAEKNYLQFDVGGKYEVIANVMAGVSDEKHFLGSNTKCRFCHRTDKKFFRKRAHTFPEALGNKWVISLDECDICNDTFAAFDSALVDAVSPILTLGGVKGKNSRIRQTGRSNGDRVLTHSAADKPRGLMSICRGFDIRDVNFHLIEEGKLRMKFPVAGVPFKPRAAFKALTKMAFALLPDAELSSYERTRQWLLDPKEDVLFRRLEVAMSFGSIGNSPEIVSGTLLRRVDPKAPVPHILFLFCAGSVCLQMGLMSDHLDGRLFEAPGGSIRFNWRVILGPSGGPQLELIYGDLVHRNWSSAITEPQPIDFFWLDFDPQTCVGKFTPQFRSNVLN